MKKSVKWSILLLLGLLCLSAFIVSATADKCCTPHHYQRSFPYTVPVKYMPPVYTAPVWHYTAPVWKYTAPIWQPVVQISSKIYYPLSIGKYYSFAPNSYRFPGFWWV